MTLDPLGIYKEKEWIFTSSEPQHRLFNQKCIMHYNIRAKITKPLGENAEVIFIMPC